MYKTMDFACEDYTALLFLYLISCFSACLLVQLFIVLLVFLCLIVIKVVLLVIVSP